MKITVGLCLLVLACSTGVYAQSVSGSGAVTGMVRDQYEDGLPEAKVVLSNEALGIHKSVTTTDDGVFDMPALPPSGTYKLRVTRTGFANWDSNEFDVAMGQTVYMKIDMKVEEPATPTEAARAISAVDDNRAGISTLVTGNQFDSLPFFMRRVDAAVLLAPAVTTNPTTGELSFRGSPYANAFFTDGLLTTDIFNPYQPGIANYLAPDALTEMQVIVAAPSAEFAHSAGGMVNAGVRTGGNGFHGDGYGYYSSNAWSTAERFAMGNKLFQKQTDAGGSLGGPVMRNRLFFFLNGDVLNGRFNDMNRITTPLLADPTGTFIPSGNCKSTVLACNAAVNLIQPQMNVITPLSQRWTTGIVRLDYRFNNGDSIGLLANAMDSRLPIGPNVQAVAPNGGLLGINNSTFDTRYAKASWLHTFFPKGINELRAGYHQDHMVNPASTANLPTGDVALSLLGANIGSAHPDASQLVERHAHVVDNFNWTAFSHSLRAGVEYYINRDSVDDVTNPFGSYVYPSLTGLATDLVGNNQRNYTSFRQSLGISSRRVQQKQMRAFAQDTWKVRKGLTVTGGVNWEKTKFQQPSYANPTYYQTGSIPSRTVDFAPRLSVAWQPDQRTVVRLGFGWYFAPYPGNLMDALRLGNGLDQYSLSSVPYQSGAPVFPKSVATPATIPTGLLNIWFANSKFRNPYTQQITVAVERRVTRDTDVTLNLVTARGYKLWTADDTNLISPVVGETYTIDNAAGQAADTYSTLIWTTSLVNATGTSTVNSLHTSDPNHEHVYQIGNDGTSWYNAALLQVRHQMGRSLSAQLSYAFSHAIDDVGGPQFLPGVPIISIPGNVTADKGSSAADQRHRGTLNFVWTPRILKNDSPTVRLLVNGWQLSGIATVATPQSVTPLVVVSGQQFPNITMEYLNSLNGSGGWGRVPFYGVNAYRLGTEYMVNARAAKIFAATERIRATVAFEAYNLFDNQFTTGVNPIAFIATGGILRPAAGAGQPNASSAYPYGSTARRAQVSVRFEF